MLELRHSPWCEGLDCAESMEEPLEPLEGEDDLEGSPLEGSGSQDDTISSSLQLVLPSDYAPSRVNSKSAILGQGSINRQLLSLPHLPAP